MYEPLLLYAGRDHETMLCSHEDAVIMFMSLLLLACCLPLLSSAPSLTFRRLDLQDALNRANQDITAMSSASSKVMAVLAELIRQVAGKLLTKNRRVTMSLITILSHQKDVIDELVRKRVVSPADFDWQRQVLPCHVIRVSRL